MADMQRAGMTGKASMRIPVSGNVQVGGKIMKELRFMPYSEFPETGREETLYIDTDGNTLYYYDGAYIVLSGGGGGGTGDYNELSNKPQINGNVLTGNKTASSLGLQETISDIETIRSGAASGSTAVQPSDMESALSEKQDTISDLQTIRSGAALGATAVQPSDMETALADKQDVIDDLNDIRTGAGLGATAIQPADMETALANKQDVISDLDAIRSGATAGNTALQPEDIDTLPTYGSSNPVSSGGTYNFVNSSIATNTAYFIGTFASVAELEAYAGTVTNNDYAFVTSTDSAGNTLYNRYKYNAATQTWSFEYAVNNTAFTAAQWAAIQSGLTASDKTKLDGIEQGANKTVIDASPTSGSSNAVSSGGVYTALSGKQDTISDLSDIRSGASAGSTAVQPSALTDYQTKLSGTNKLDPAYIEYDASHRAVSDAEKSTWNGKQDAISDLSTIRSGAAAGATALQQSDVTSTYSASGTAPVNGTAVNAAIGTLDVSSVGGTGKVISAISETDGKISATATTMDTTPTANSQNPVTSGGVAASQAAQDAEIAVIANAGAKNFADFNFGGVVQNANVKPGTIVCIESNGTFSFSGTSDDKNYAAYVLKQFLLKAGTYKISGVSGGSNTTYWMRIGTGTTDTGLFNLYDAEREFDIASDTLITVQVVIFAKQTVSNLVFKPMIRLASITDSTFVPYALPNPTLTPAAIKAVDEGAKNLVALDISTVRSLNTNATWTSDDTCVKGGITYKFNTDGTIVANGTADASASKFIKLKSGFPVTKGLIASCGLPAVSQDQSKGLLQLDYPTGSDLNVDDYERSKEVDRDGTVELYITVRGGITVSNLIFKPMICTAADWAVSQKFVPYAMSNAELTASISNWESYDCLDTTHPNDIDINNSELTVYHNAFLKRVVISCKIKFLLQRTSASTALLIGSIGNIPNYTNLIPLNSVREFVSTSDYDAFIAKNATNYAIAFAVNSGTLAANTEIRAQFEYTYF